ncbi:MAG: NAD(P)H-quinone oxidoreductase subunit 3 [Gammaproteobacteria bacterium]|nr:NAD(P)H-quinone oxidoreductase subunit 3 [Gammaproteobacteria bacterium]
MLENYVPILIFLAISGLLGVVLLSLGFILAPRKPDSEKLSPYECGFEAFEDTRMRFDVRYYLVAILFIIFDLEIAFLFPWAVVLDDFADKGRQIFVLLSMAIFVGILVIGLLYEYKKGALEWD